MTSWSGCLSFRNDGPLAKYRLSASFLLLAFAAAFIATRAYTPAYAFHMALFSLGSVLAVVGITSALRAADSAGAAGHRRRAQHNYGPVKFASLAALFWGTAGFLVGCIWR